MMTEAFNSLVLKVIKANKGCFTQDGLRHVKTLPFLSVVQAVKGQYEISLDNCTPEFTGQGGCFIAPANAVQDIIHHFSSKNEPMIARWVFIDVKVEGIIDFFQFYNIPMVIEPEASAPFGNLINELLEVQKQDDSFLKQITLHRIAFALTELICSISVPGKDSIKKICMFEKILPALVYADSADRGEVNVARLAQASGLSVPRFHALFKEAAGMSPMSYIREQRLTQSCALLVTTSMSIAEIACRTGFYDQFHYNRAFKQRYKCSPLQYRKDYIQQHKIDYM